MRISKEIADKSAKKFRAELNKAAKDGMIHTVHWALSSGVVISFEVKVGNGEIKSFPREKGEKVRT